MGNQSKKKKCYARVNGELVRISSASVGSIGTAARRDMFDSGYSHSRADSAASTGDIGSLSDVDPNQIFVDRTEVSGRFPPTLGPQSHIRQASTPSFDSLCGPPSSTSPHGRFSGHSRDGSHSSTGSTYANLVAANRVPTSTKGSPWTGHSRDTSGDHSPVSFDARYPARGARRPSVPAMSSPLAHESSPELYIPDQSQSYASTSDRYASPPRGVPMFQDVNYAGASRGAMGSPQPSPRESFSNSDLHFDPADPSFYSYTNMQGVEPNTLPFQSLSRDASQEKRRRGTQSPGSSKAFYREESPGYGTAMEPKLYGAAASGTSAPPQFPVGRGPGVTRRDSERRRGRGWTGSFDEEQNSLQSYYGEYIPPKTERDIGPDKGKRRASSTTSRVHQRSSSEHRDQRGSRDSDKAARWSKQPPTDSKYPPASRTGRRDLMRDQEPGYSLAEVRGRPRQRPEESAGTASSYGIDPTHVLPGNLRTDERDYSVRPSERRHKRTSLSVGPTSRHSSSDRSGRQLYEEASAIPGQASGMEASQDAQDLAEQEQARNHAMRTRNYYDFDTGPTVTTLCWSDAPQRKPRKKNKLLHFFT